VPIFQRKGAARRSRNQNQLHKEARKPGILSDGSWLPGFLIKKSSRNVTMLRDSTAKSAKLDEQARQRLKKFRWTTPAGCGK
jgi:hypothetical protein